MTRPAGGDAAAVGAAELPRLTAALRAGGLVGAVAAVVCTVAQLEGERAVEVGALELSRQAVADGWKNGSGRREREGEGRRAGGTGRGAVADGWKNGSGRREREGER